MDQKLGRLESCFFRLGNFGFFLWGLHVVFKKKMERRERRELAIYEESSPELLEVCLV